jgi:hypothetical protein
MNSYLFRFGFCTPAQWKSNKEHSWDDESSEAFFIRADSSDAAESWGCEVAERFCYQLFKQSDEWSGQIPSWKETKFAFWIESDTGSLPKECLEQLPTINFGEVPDFVRWLAK